MPIWSEVDINRFSQEAEDTFLTMTHCVIDRLSLYIEPGINEYVIPDYVVRIRRITWKGDKIDPLPHRIFRDWRAFNGMTAKPDWYVFNNIGSQKIRFYPTPNEEVASSVETPNKLYSSEISKRVIIEFSRTSDYTTMRIPEYLRRRLIKSYVMMKCFSMENTGQNIQVSQYFSNKWKLLSEVYGNLIQELISKPRKLILTGGWEFGHSHYESNWRRGLPISRYGIGVNAGE